jgi:hypothetical protein
MVVIGSKSSDLWPFRCHEWGKVRRPFTTAEAYERGFSPSSLKWAVKSGSVQRVEHGVYVNGSEPVSVEEKALALVLVTEGAAFGTLAGVLHTFDGVWLRSPFAVVPRQQGLNRDDVVKRDSESFVFVDGYRCTDGLQTLLDLAKYLTDDRWEQALESALRMGLTTIEAIIDALHVRRVGNSRIRRVLALRPEGAPPTGSILETMMVQLLRKDPSIPTPQRQVEVLSRHGSFIAYADLAWPDLGVFVELDGQQHDLQRVYDARRETSIVATKGWLPGRFTWYEVTRIPQPTLRRVRELLQSASARAA